MSIEHLNGEDINIMARYIVQGMPEHPLPLSATKILHIEDCETCMRGVHAVAGDIFEETRQDA